MPRRQLKTDTAKEPVVGQEELLRQIVANISEYVPTGLFTNFHMVALAQAVNSMRKELGQPVLPFADIRKVFQAQVIAPRDEPAVRDDDDKKISHFGLTIYHEGLPPAYWPRLLDHDSTANVDRGLASTAAYATKVAPSTATETASTKRSRQPVSSTSTLVKKPSAVSKQTSVDVPSTGSTRTLQAIDPVGFKTAHLRRRLWRYMQQALFLAQWNALSEFDTVSRSLPVNLKDIFKQKVPANVMSAAEPRLELARANCEWKRKVKEHYAEDFAKLMDFLRLPEAAGAHEHSKDRDQVVPRWDAKLSSVSRESLPTFVAFVRDGARKIHSAGHLLESLALLKTADVIELFNEQYSDAAVGDDAEDEAGLVLASESSKSSRLKRHALDDDDKARKVGLDERDSGEGVGKNPSKKRSGAADTTTLQAGAGRGTLLLQSSTKSRRTSSARATKK